jgi:transcription elongation factor GreA
MKNEMTKQDIAQIQEELRRRRTELMPRQLQAVQEARAFGDLSEKFEYKAAKQELNRNKGRIRYLQRMLDNAVVISDQSAEGVIGLFDKVEAEMVGMDERVSLQIVTAMRANALEGLITRDSPVGQAIFGHRAGDVVHVQVRKDFGYDLKILSVEKQEDDGSIKISEY